MNQLATSGSNAVAALQNLKSGLARVAATLPRAGGDPLLRLGKDGIWVYGAENVEVEEGSLWAVNPVSLLHGFISWTDYDDADKKTNEIKGEIMVSFVEPQPARAELPNTGWDWTEQVSFRLKCLSGEDKGTEVEYKTTSVGGIRAVRELIAAIMAQLDKDETKPAPIVLLESDSYQHKKWGKTYVPAIEIKDWMGMEGPEGEAEPEPKQEPEQPARTRARRAAKAEPEEEQATEEQEPEEPAASPVRRRRRR